MQRLIKILLENRVLKGFEKNAAVGFAKSWSFSHPGALEKFMGM